MILLRAPNADDFPFIVSSWLDSYRREGANRHMSGDVYVGIQKPRVLALMGRSTVLVAANETDSWQVFGWSAYEGVAMHYVYVKGVYRRMGVGRRLFDACGRPPTATHTGWLFDKLRTRWGVSYDPRGAAS